MQRLTRRGVLGAGAAVATWTAAGVSVPRLAAGGAARSFGAIAPSKADAVIVPEGYSADVVLRWGDPLSARARGLDARSVAQGYLMTKRAVSEQAHQFGYNCDGLGFFPLGHDSALLCVNHEYPSPALLFPGWVEAREQRALGEFVRANPSAVSFMQMSVGLSVVEIERHGRWRYNPASRFNRRVTAATPIELSGPAKTHRLLNPRGVRVPLVRGTLNNCAAGVTPWGTYLTAEENIENFFGNGRMAELTDELAAAHARFGLRQFDSSHRWEYVDPRFDSARYPAESLKYGWIVEIDPRNPKARPKKRTALGRFKHEGATTVLARDGRAVVYMGDDEQFEYLYKFVTRKRFDAERPDANLDLLDEGTLYVARFAADGTGRWMALEHGGDPELTAEQGFAAQADVVLRCRAAADRLHATPLDRPEDIAVHPHTGNVYVSCTQNLARGGGVQTVEGRELDTGTDAVNPRGPNTAGHIVELKELGDDAASTSFRWEVFVLAGAPEDSALLATLPRVPLASDKTYFGGIRDPRELSAFANPDNLGFDADGNLWIVTDGLQPNGNNNGCFMCPTEGIDRGRVQQFMSGPVGAEICGCEFSSDGRTLFLAVQHPGENGSLRDPTSHWPDGTGAAPRPSVVAIEPTSPQSRFSG